MEKKEKIGLYGGSFDPIHHGHLILARDAMEQLGLSRIIFIPAARSPLKPDTDPASPEIRLAMVRAAVENEPGFETCDVEIHRPPPSFTVNTVREFVRDFPNAEIHYLIGEDNIATLDKWVEIDALRAMVTFVVLARAGEGSAEGFIRIQRQLEISSTEIRNRVAQRLPIRYLVPMQVADIIASQGLYLHD